MPSGHRMRLAGYFNMLWTRIQGLHTCLLQQPQWALESPKETELFLQAMHDGQACGYLLRLLKRHSKCSAKVLHHEFVPKYASFLHSHVHPSLDFASLSDHLSKRYAK